ncbi:hypothetical protein L3Q82_021038 [Scortum barcoo]|uniref:Uncharacterized protein n=1 Tax=Scortum barcoo TaxID=214431 RepID=A0ACB8X4Y5_9TELE|nr:hypothetical protein L3Q82_021038 [Scortum barcoo]
MRTTVERVNSFRFLGVHISEDLTWTHHTDFITKSARQRLFFLCRLRKAQHGLKDTLQLLQVTHREDPDWLHHRLSELQEVKTAIANNTAAFRIDLEKVTMTVSDMERSLSACSDDVTSLQDTVQKLERNVESLQ